MKSELATLVLEGLCTETMELQVPAVQRLRSLLLASDKSALLARARTLIELAYFLEEELAAEPAAEQLRALVDSFKASIREMDEAKEHERADQARRASARILGNTAAKTGEPGARAPQVGATPPKESRPLSQLMSQLGRRTIIR